MGEMLQKGITFLIRGWPELWGWITSFLGWAHNIIDQCIILHHSIWAGIVLFVIIAIPLLWVFGAVWKRVPKPKKPEETVIAPRPYRLLALCAVIAALYLAACFSAMD